MSAESVLVEMAERACFEGLDERIVELGKQIGKLIEWKVRADDRLRTLEDNAHRPSESDQLALPHKEQDRILTAIKERDELRATNDQLKQLIYDYENREASCCPEDTNFEDEISRLRTDRDKWKEKYEAIDNKIIRYGDYMFCEAEQRYRNDLREHFEIIGEKIGCTGNSYSWITRIACDVIEERDELKNSKIGKMTEEIKDLKQRLSEIHEKSA